MELIKVGLLFGGKSAEHEISLRSALHIWKSLDPQKYQVIPIGIDKNGDWYLNAQIEQLDQTTQLSYLDPQNKVTDLGTLNIDIAFPILHGPYGEDGQVQALLFQNKIPFIGSGELSSKTCMDKDLTKQALNRASIPTCRHFAFSFDEKPSFNDIQERLGTPLFVKPANMGSSVGVYKVTTEKDYEEALLGASKYDSKIIVEEYIRGRELECGLLGTHNTQASPVAEILPGDHFYSFDDKYSSNSTSQFKLPAELDQKTTLEIQEMSLLVFKTLKCKGFARCDFFLKEDGSLLVNEINTIPGCTSISMFPKVWDHVGVSTTKWTDQLIQEMLI